MHWLYSPLPKKHRLDLRFEDLTHKAGVKQLIQDLELREKVAKAIGTVMGIPQAEVDQMVSEHEESLAFSRKAPSDPDPKLTRILILTHRGST